MFGYEDRLLNRLANSSNSITSNHLQQLMYPVHAIDVGAALEQMIHDDTTAAQTYELYGPTEYSMAEIADLVDKEIYKKRRRINIPKSILKPTKRYLNKFLWWPVGSEDQVEREFIDQTIDPSAKTFKDLDIEPVDLKSMTYQYLVSFAALHLCIRPDANHSTPVERIPQLVIL